MSRIKNAKNVVHQRKRAKLRMIRAFGDKCGTCGYNKCTGALEFHHVDPNEKDFSFNGKIRAWNIVVKELRKCVLVCANCHREIHSGLREISDNIHQFDEYYVDPENFRDTVYSAIPKVVKYCKCGQQLKDARYKHCSHECAHKASRKVDWNNVNLPQLLKENNNNFCAVGRLLGISDVAVRKHYKKYNN